MTPLVNEAGLNQRVSELQRNLDAHHGAYSTVQLDDFAKEVSRCVELSRTADFEKDVVVALGFPGVGKTTQVRLLVRSLSGSRHHLGKFAATAPVSNDERVRIEVERSSGRLISGMSAPFLDAVAADPSTTLILDGFPRTPEDAVLLMKTAVTKRWNVRVLNLTFPATCEVIKSLERQVSRHCERQAAIPDALEIQRYLQKLERHINFASHALSVLKRGGVAFETLEIQNQTVAAVNCSVHERLRELSPKPRWDSTYMDAVSIAAAQCGVPRVVLSCAAFYTAFWNERFGPPWQPYDIHVGVQTFEDAVRMRAELQRTHPAIRFKVQPVPQFLDTLKCSHLAIKESDIFEGPTPSSPLCWQHGFVELVRGNPVVRATDQCLTDLRAGILRVDDEMLEGQSDDRRRAILLDAGRRAEKLIAQYPALILDGTLDRIVRAAHGEITPTAYEPQFNRVQSKVRSIEQERLGKSRWNVGVLPEEVSEAISARDFLRSLEGRAEAIPVPPPAELPGLLGELQRDRASYKDTFTVHLGEQTARYKEHFPAPTDYSSWLHYMAIEATDPQWREWLINQWRSKHPFCGRDPWLEKILSLDVTDALHRSTMSPADSLSNMQKPTHHGVALPLHLVWSAVVLDTSDLERGASETVRRNLPELRTGMRLAMLCHDLGKLGGEAARYTPGVHEILGAKIFEEVVPEWVSPLAKRIGVWCVGYHDILGRLARGLTEKAQGMEDDVTATPTYLGAYDPSACREALRQLPLPSNEALLLCKAIWRADVGSIPALRFLASAADALGRVIESSARR